MAFTLGAGSLVQAFGGLAVVSSSFMPWVVLGPNSLAGIGTWYGTIALVFGLAVFVTGMSLFRYSSEFGQSFGLLIWVALFISSACLVGCGLAAVLDFHDLASSLTVDYVFISGFELLGSGLWTLFAAGLIVTGVCFWQFFYVVGFPGLRE